MILLVVAIHVASAQGAGIGIKGGLNFPGMDALGEDPTQVTASAVDKSSGFHLGFFARVRLAKIGIQPEVLYSFTSIEFGARDLLTATDYNVEQKLGYLTVPIILKWYTVAGINLQAGPQFGFILDGDQTSDITGAKTTTQIKDGLNGTDIGLNLGAGIDLPFGLDIHGRYILGITDVNDVPGTEASRNSMFQVSLGYAFVDIGR